MAFTEQEIAEIVRQRLGDADASRRARILWAIPQAIDRLARKVAANPAKRSLLMTNRDTTSQALDVNGEMNLQTFISDPTKPKLLIEYLRHGNIWYVGADVTAVNPFTPRKPLQWMAPQFGNSSIHGFNIFQTEFIYYWLEGMRLKTLEVEPGNPLTGTLYFNVSYTPKLADFNAGLEELHDDLIEKVIEVCVGPGADTAEDAEH